jgi:hypothetical protein
MLGTPRMDDQRTLIYPQIIDLHKKSMRVDFHSVTNKTNETKMIEDGWTIGEGKKFE